MAKKKTARRAAKSAPKSKARKPARSAGRKGASAASKSGAGKSKPSTSMRDLALALHNFSHKMITDMIDGVPESHVVSQVAPVNNHVIWTLGHLAMTSDWLATLIDGKPSRTPKNYDPLFGMGSKPTGDLSNYPSLKEVRAEYDRSFDRLVSAAKARTDAELFEPPAGDSSGFTTNKLDSLLKGAWHEGWHIGQIADLRRGLGIKPMMGNPG